MKNYDSFWWQFGNSFLPMNYFEYENVDKKTMSVFLRIFAVIVYVVIAAGFLFAASGGNSEINSGKALSDEDGFYYRIKNGELVIDEPILVDDLSSGVYVNITDEVEYFDGGDNLTALLDKGYSDILLISKTNRVKVYEKSEGNHVMGYVDFDNMETAGYTEVSVSSAVSIDAKFIFIILIVGVIVCVLYPFIVKLSALILALIAGLLCRLFKLDADREYLKIIGVYAFVPSQILILIANTVYIFIYGLAFYQANDHGSVYFAIETAAAVLPLIMVLAAAFADKKRYE